MHILIVEDDARLRALLYRALEAEGWRAETAPGIRPGLTRALTGSFDLLFLGLRPSGREGWDALRALRAGRPDLPVIVLSHRADLPTKLHSFELGAVDYVARPFSIDELLARARVHLRQLRVSERATVIRVNGLALDLARRRAQIGDAVIELTDRQFRVLHFLMAHVGQVVSRERLLTEVWGDDPDARSNVVDACVARLRRRLGPEAPIETVRNAGYRAAA